MTLPGDDVMEAASAGAEDLVVDLEELGLQILPGSEPAVEGDVQGVYVRALAALPCRLEQRWRRLNVMEAARSTCTMSSKTGMLFDDIAQRCRKEAVRELVR